MVNPVTKKLAEAREEEREAQEFVQLLIRDLQGLFGVKAMGFIVRPEVKKTTKKQK